MRAQAPAGHPLEETVVRSAAAPDGLRSTVDGARDRWVRVGATASGCWCARDGQVVVLTTGRGAGLPNAVIMGGPDRGWTDADTEIWIGRGIVETSAAAWRVARWWNSRPSPAPLDAEKVAELIARGGWAIEPRLAAFVDRLVAGDAEGSCHAALGLLGRGSGLTPEGDDLLLGGIAMSHFAGSSLPDDGLVSTLATSRRPVLEAAGHRTTQLSRSLLDHAYRGEVAAPLGSLLTALTGRGSLASALRTLQATGASSGDAWARGAAWAAARIAGVIS